MRPRRRTPSWLEDVARRHRLVAPAAAAFPSLRYKRVQGRRGVTYMFSVIVPVPYYEARRVRIEFRSLLPSSPKIFADGPTESPHRYRHEGDRNLCLWYPSDGPDRRWQPDDGLLQLLGLIEAHLFKEAYWRETGEWLGDEGPHGESVVRPDAAKGRAA